MSRLILTVKETNWLCGQGLWGARDRMFFLLTDVCGEAWKATLWSNCNPNPTPCLTLSQALEGIGIIGNTHFTPKDIHKTNHKILILELRESPFSILSYS